jgi:hypothetical protein
MRYSVTILVIGIFLITTPKGYSYDNVLVHQNINGQAVLQSIQLFNALRTLGFTGSDAKQVVESNIVRGQNVMFWFREGARLEDETVCRSRSHFHDPFKDWASAGLNNPAVNAACLIKGESFSADSSVVWSQKKETLTSPKNYWSWPKARDYYYQALATNNDARRQDSFANAFRSLGQVMHLLADVSVPAHVRNDIHVFPVVVPFIGVEVGGQTYESWAQRNFRRLNYMARHVPPNIIDAAVVSDLAKIPISALWVQGKYPGTNPEITWATNPVPVGLAEYTNANFFSEDTIFRDYPHPARENTTARLVEQTARDGITDRALYIQGYTSQRLAAYSYFGEYEDQIPEKQWLYNLDDFVYEDYASQLVPRAVGYSAGLLNYFFRGTIEISAPSSYIYSITDGSQTPYTDSAGSRHPRFVRLRAKIRNSTAKERDTTGNPISYEAMQSGVLHAVARYKIVPGFQPDLSGYPPNGEVMRSVPFSYSVSMPIPISSLSSSEATEFAFDFSNDPIPAGITDLILQVVFKGTLGGENDIAVAVGMRDLTEPTHHLFWNLTDMFSLDGHLYAATMIKSTPSLANLVDFDHDGTFSETGEPYIDPQEMNFDISYMAEGQQVSQIAARAAKLSAGRHARLIMLADSPSGNGVRLSWLSPDVVKAGSVDFTFQGVTNQTVNGLWQASPPVISFRGVKSHFSQGVLNCYPTAVADRCTYLESEAPPGNPAPVRVDVLLN